MHIKENTVIHGDSLTMLQQMEPETVDAIITDPPYGIELDNEYFEKTKRRIERAVK